MNKQDILMLWDSMENPSWSNLIDVINDYLNRPEWENNVEFARIRDFADKMLGEPFPASTDELYQMLNDQMYRER